jgi:transposase
LTPDEETVSICAQTCASGVSVAQVARRYAMNTDLIHKWLRDPKFAPDVEIVEDAATGTPCFFPVESVDRSRTKGTVPTTDATPAQSAIGIDILGGHRLRIVGGYDPEALARLIRGFSE